MLLLQLDFLLPTPSKLQPTPTPHHTIQPSAALLAAAALPLT
jgi:hypothetical protein